ncbi:MAG: ATP-binding protein, partial [bacterium]
LERVELLAEDRLGYWESEAGYHNRADPWREERYVAPDVSPQDVKLLLQNLISNAIKFSDPSRPPVVTLAHSITSAGRLQISVQDNGIGIEPAHFDRVFGLFQRLHSHDVYGGSGIGLALCRRIAVNHGSDIKLASEPGRGSSFTFSLERHIE